MNECCDRMSDKVCLITGAGRGIGSNIAHAMGMAGGAIALSDINPERGAAVRDELTAKGVVAEFFPADLSAKGEPRRVLEAVVQRFGGLHVLVNNARAGKRASFAEESEENWDLTMGVNLRAAFFLVQAALPLMSKNSVIVNIGSLSGLLVSQESPSYQVSKAGLLHLTRYLAMQAGAKGIRVNTVLPGFIVQDEHRALYDGSDTEQSKYREVAEAIHPLRGGPGYSGDIASAVMFLASEEARFITGQQLIVDGGLSIQDPTNLAFLYLSKSK